MIDAKFFIGAPKKFNSICVVYPPLVKDILTNDEYFLYKKMLTLSWEDIEDEKREKGEPIDNLPSSFEWVMELIKSDPRGEEVFKAAMKFFTHEDATVLKDINKIIIGSLEEVLPKLKNIEDLKIIDSSNYEEFQNLIREACGEPSVQPLNPQESMKVRDIKAKGRARERILAKSKTNLSFTAMLASICCMDFGLNPLNIGELSYAAIPTLMRYYQEKTKYQIDIESLLAGADSKKVKPQTWIRNIDD